MSQLVEYGRQALQTRDYERAACLFRESVRRAPFRQDLKDLLAMAIQGNLEEKSQAPVRPEPRPRPAVSPQPRPPQPRPEPRSAARPDPEDDRLDPPRPRPRPEPGSAAPRLRPPDPQERSQAPQPARTHYPENYGNELPLPGLTPGFGEHPAQPAAHPAYPHGAPPHVGAAGPRGAYLPPPRPTARPGTKRRPVDFGRRHQRGPISAYLLCGFIGMLLLAATAAGAWYYINYSKSTAGQAAAGKARFESVRAQVENYRNKEQFARAIEMLNALPKSPPRNTLLAQIYNEMGDQLFLKKPPNFQGAIEGYKKALIYDKSTRYGMNLGEAYVQLAKEKRDDRGQFEGYLKAARQSFEAVLAFGPAQLALPDQLKAMDQLAKVFELLHMQKESRDMWKKVIELAPDSPEAQMARKNIYSLGYRLD